MDTINLSNLALAIGETAKLMGVSEKTLRDWDKTGKFPCQKTIGGHRRYTIEAIREKQGNCSPGIYDEFIQKDFVQKKENLEKVFNFWKEKGYVSDGKNNDDKNLALLLSNYLNYVTTNEHLLLNEGEDEEDTETETMLKLTASMWKQMQSKSFVSVQPMSSPASLAFFIDMKPLNLDNLDTTKIVEVNMEIHSDAVAAKTFKFESVSNLAAFPIIKMYEFYANAFAREMDYIIVTAIMDSSPIIEKIEFLPDDTYIMVPISKAELLQKIPNCELDLDNHYAKKSMLSKIGTLNLKEWKSKSIEVIAGPADWDILNHNSLDPQSRCLIGHKPIGLDAQLIICPYILVCDGLKISVKPQFFMSRCGFKVTNNKSQIRRYSLNHI
jgi:hypothetical protein